MWRKSVVLGTALAAAMLTSAASAETEGAAAYKACAACHLPDGAGVPGAFPPLRNRIAASLNDEAARKYLVAVVTNGLNGPITVASNGMSYAGFMQPFGATMDAGKIAAVLNYVSTELRDDKSADIKAFSADEVTALQQEVKGKPAVSLRPAGY